MRLTKLLAALEEQPERWQGVPAGGEREQIEVSQLAYDSRKVTPGTLFIAVPGTHTDGRKYLANAAQRGAVAALGPALDDLVPSDTQLPLPYIPVRNVLAALADLASAFYGYPAQQLCTIGVTGTDGKTSAKLACTPG